MQLAIDGTEDIEIYHPNVILISKQNFPVVEKRVFFLIYEALKELQTSQSDLIEGKPIEVKISKARERAGSVQWETWKKLGQQLASRTYSAVDESNKKFHSRPFFQSVDYADGTGELAVTLNPQMNDAWLNLSSGYTKQMLSNCLALSSNYSISFYNLICRYDTGRVIEVTWLREYLDIVDKYNNWSDLKRHVLDVAKTEIEEKTDYHLMWTIVERRRKKVTRIKLWGEPKSSLTDEQDIEHLNGKLDELGIIERSHRTFIFNHFDDFTEAIRKMNVAGRKGEIKNKGGYLLKVLGLIETTAK
jgi:plasmid replication initiation protein